ncbi:MAG: DUF1631 domain-containing protein [Pseudomonadales bacterium]|nr:DUF1631 domain-containing protein [Pseudomonadales bacterium]
MQPNHPTLLKEIASKVAEHIEPLYSNCFEGVNDELFALAEKATNNKIQSEVFDGMREIRSRRQSLEDNFFEAIESTVDNFFASEKLEQPTLDILVPENATGELSLVDLKDLDERIAYGSAVQKANGLYFNALFEFNQRLAILNNGYKIDDHSNPFGPARLTQIFANINKALDISQMHRNLLLKTFSTYVLEELEELYAQCNSLLIEAGILPDLKYDVRKQPQSAPEQTTPEQQQPEVAPIEPPVQDPAAQAPSTQAQPGASQRPFETNASPASYSVQHGDSAPELYHSIQEILSSRSADSSWSLQPNQSQQKPVGGEAKPVANEAPAQSVGQRNFSQPDGTIPVNVFASGSPSFAQNPIATDNPSAATGAPAQYYNNTQLVNVISSMQQQRLPDQLVFDANHIEETKQQFIQQLSASADPANPQEINGLDADTIDLIGMLFEFMLNDQDLCPSVKALLSHLHTPFLKVALLDKDFFTQHNHPARQLLNSMAKAGARWIEENDKDHGAFPKMKAVVDRILLEFDINLELFSELNHDFNQYIEQLQKRSDIAEKRASESIKGKEKLRLARDQAIREINQRSQNRSIPESVDQFLRQCWLDILVFTLLRKGEKHPLWEEQKTLIEQLIWSTTPKSTQKELQQVRNKVVDISQIIARGFEQLGGYPGNSKDLLRKIAVLQNELIDNPPTQQPEPISVVPTAKKEKTAVSSKTTTAESVAGPSAESSTTAKAKAAITTKAPTKKFSPELLEAIKQLRAIPFGTWFQFTTNAQGDTIKGKLSWYSPATSRYMFVNARGKQIAVRSMLSLANSMRLGDAVVLQDKKKPLVDRAMLAVYELIKVPKPIA